MVTFDTNVLVRILLGDDPAQTKRAERLFKEHAFADGIFVPLIVVAELAWVLSAGYALERVQIHERLKRLVRTRGVFVEELELVHRALAAYAASRVDLADLLILGAAAGKNALPLFTFDRKLSRVQQAHLVG